MDTRHLESGRYQLVGTVENTGPRVVRQAVDEWSARAVILVEVGGPGDDEPGPDARARVARETRIAIGVRATHLVPVTGESADAGRLWVVSDGLPGHTLQSALRAARTPTDVLHWARDVAEGLAVVHHAGLVHRVLLGRRRRPVPVGRCRHDHRDQRAHRRRRRPPAADRPSGRANRRGSLLGDRSSQVGSGVGPEPGDAPAGAERLALRVGPQSGVPVRPRVRATVARISPPQTDTTEIAGRAAVVRPNYFTGYPQSCTVDLGHRAYTAENGTARVEALRLTVYAGRQPNPDQACAQTTAVANAVASALPPPG